MRPLPSFLNFFFNLAFVGLSLFSVHVIMQDKPTPSPSFVMLGTGGEGDPCTVKIEPDIIPESIEAHLRKWPEACKVARAANLEKETIE